MQYERNTRGAQFENTVSGLLGSESLYTLCSKPWSEIFRDLDVSQRYGPPRPVTGIALPFLNRHNNIKLILSLSEWNNEGCSNWTLKLTLVYNLASLLLLILKFTIMLSWIWI
jgi:hypothetical protein